MREYFETLFPTLPEIGIDRAWEGLFAMTPDGLPYIGPHRRYPGHAFALGYGGNGMTFAALSARILLEQWRGIDSPDHQLFAFNRFAARLGRSPSLAFAPARVRAIRCLAASVNVSSFAGRRVFDRHVELRPESRSVWAPPTSGRPAECAREHNAPCEI